MKQPGLSGLRIGSGFSVSLVLNTRTQLPVLVEL